MIYVIFAYVFAIVLAHFLLFLRSDDLGKIIVMNSAISCFAVAMSMLTFYFKDTNFIDVIFFYIIMSPIGFYGLFLYYKYRSKNKNPDNLQNNTDNSNNAKVAKNIINFHMQKKEINTKKNNQN